MNIEKLSSTVLLLSILSTNNYLALSHSQWDLSIHLPPNLRPLFSVVMIINSHLDLVPADHGCVALQPPTGCGHWKSKPRLPSSMPGRSSAEELHASQCVHFWWAVWNTKTWRKVESSLSFAYVSFSRLLLKPRSCHKVCMLAEKQSALPVNHVTTGAAPRQLFLIDPLAWLYNYTAERHQSPLQGLVMGAEWQGVYL